MSATGRGALRAERDYYATTQWCLRGLMNEVCADKLHGRHVLDPCAGDGRIGQSFETLGANVTYLDALARHPADFTPTQYSPTTCA